MNEPRLNLPELTVSELSAALKRTIEDAHGYVRVRGELGKVSYHGNGHVYFDLKDDRACIAGVIWRSRALRIQLRLEAGLEVVVTGRLTTYPGRSQYQIIVETLEPAGIGALMALVEERKRKLAAEGLFDEARKQLLPFLPAIVGVITSPSGAVIRDILHRLADRFPRCVLLWPVKVQGEGSAVEIAAAIHGFNALPERGDSILPPRPDLIIVARGGGSLEDLWSFNEEIVVRAAAASLIPLISAVGHETDVTLIDFAADRRAPTPTAAAEMAVPVRSERTNAHVHHVRFSRVAGRLSDRLLRTAIDRRRERYGSLSLRLRAGVAANLTIHRTRIGQERERLAAFGERVRRAIRHSIALRTLRAERGGELLAAFSYRGVLARGFALVRDAKGRPLRTAAAITAGMPLDIEFADGRIGARAETPSGVERVPTSSSKTRGSRAGGSGQGDLF